MTAPTTGFVLAVTGETYVTLARRAARNMRDVMPEAEIDLFTDIVVDDPVFSQVHALSESWFRPKMEALLNSRFDRTFYLDADVMVVGDLSSVFEVLDRYDIAVCHNRNINGEPGLRQHTRALPDAFCSLNAGVIAMKKSTATLDFVREWQRVVRDAKSDRDQPAFRELMYDSDLRLFILPPHHNFLTFRELETWAGVYGAPRLLHAPNLHNRAPGNPDRPFTLAEVVGARLAPVVQQLIAADRLLSPDTPDAERLMNAPIDRTLPRRLWRRLRRR